MLNCINKLHLNHPPGLLLYCNITNPETFIQISQHRVQLKYKPEPNCCLQSRAASGVPQHSCASGVPARWLWSTGSLTLAQAVAWGPISHPRQSLQKLSLHPAQRTQGKLVSGCRGDQLTLPCLEIDYAWLNNHNSKCNSLKSGSASLF